MIRYINKPLTSTWLPLLVHANQHETLRSRSWPQTSRDCFLWDNHQMIHSNSSYLTHSGNLYTLAEFLCRSRVLQAPWLMLRPDAWPNSYTSTFVASRVATCHALYGHKSRSRRWVNSQEKGRNTSVNLLRLITFGILWIQIYFIYTIIYIYVNQSSILTYHNSLQQIPFVNIERIVVAYIKYQWRIDITIQDPKCQNDPTANGI